MKYEHQSIEADGVPHAAQPLFQHIVDTYASETNKTASTWLKFSDSDLAWKPHEKSTSIQGIFQHQILSERRFFGEFMGSAEAEVATLLPPERTVVSMTARFVELATNRLSWLASLTQEAWLQPCPFFDESHERIWIFWRRVLHSAHHRTQLTVYLRLLDKAVPSTYGPTADVTWEGASPTLT